MKKLKKLILQLFADAGTLVNATGNYVNAYTGETTSFSGTNDLTPTMKTFWNTALLKNSRKKHIYSQLGMKQSLPANHGMVVEWRKPNSAPKMKALVEGVIPTGEKFGMTSLSVSLAQYGEYFALTDRLQLHAVDPVVSLVHEELSYAMGDTIDILVRNVLMSNTNILFADAINKSTGAYVSTPNSEAALQTALASYACNLTPDMVNKAVTELEFANVEPFDDGCYVCVLNPHVAYDLRSDPDWIDYHKYSATKQIFNGEIGELHGVRFLKSNNAPIIKSEGQTYATYKVQFFGKDAFGYVDPQGGGAETIIKDKSQAGGPLNQFSTVGVKCEMAAKILYPERIVTVWCGGNYSTLDSDNTELNPD